MKNYTVREVQRMVDRANDDVVFLKKVQMMLQPPMKLSMEDFRALSINYPVPKDKDRFEYWRDRIAKDLGTAQQSIVTNTKWIHDRLHKPHRCALPKKKQRELGLLPPI